MFDVSAAERAPRPCTPHRVMRWRRIVSLALGVVVTVATGCSGHTRPFVVPDAGAAGQVSPDGATGPEAGTFQRDSGTSAADALADGAAHPEDLRAVADLPGEGPSVDAGADGATGDASTDAKAAGPIFAAVQAIFDRACVLCHDANAKPIITEVPKYPQLPLTRDASYATLVHRRATEPCGGVLVVPRNPAKSYLYRKLIDDHPCSGVRMPHPGMLARTTPLPPADLMTIFNWINVGAPP